MNTTSQEKSYFDLHTSGIGYLQRVREVPVRGGRRAQPFLACTIGALVGSAKEPTIRYFDVKVSGAEAKKLVERYIGVDDPSCVRWFASESATCGAMRSSVPVVSARVKQQPASRGVC
jgi:hypothetical protein